MYFGSRVQKVVYFPSDNSDLLSSHFSVQSEVHYFWTASARILVYSQKQSILRACRVCRSHLSKLSQPLIFCFRAQPVQRYCNQSIYPYYCQQRVSTTNQPFFTGFVACCCFKLICSQEPVEIHVPARKQHCRCCYSAPHVAAIQVHACSQQSSVKLHT